MTAQAQIFAQLLPRWRASLPPEFPRPYFDSFVLRMRPTLEALVGAWMARRTTKGDAAPESWTKGARTKRNLEAMRVSKRLFRWWHLFHNPLALAMYLIASLHVLEAVLFTLSAVAWTLVLRDSRHSTFPRI